MKYLLDTDHISFLQRRAGPEYRALVARIAQHPATDFVFSVVSFHEQMLGAHTFISRAHNAVDLVRGYTLLMEILQGFTAAPVVPFDATAASILSSLHAQRIRIGTMDLRLSSIALSRGLILLTRNTRDFSKVQGLTIEDWTI